MASSVPVRVVWREACVFLDLREPFLLHKAQETIIGVML